MSGRKIVIIGAGVVGAALADELAMLGESDVAVVDKGPLFATGGSSSHAPGLMTRTSPSKFIQETGDYTIEKYGSLATDEGPALVPVGSLEVAYNSERLRELWRRLNFALSWGWRGEMLEPDEALERWPILRREGLLGAFSTAGEGLGASVRAVEAQAARAQSNGATFHGGVEVTGFRTAGSRITGVETTTGALDADIVVCCAGVWGPALAKRVGLTLPMLAMEHQYAITEPVPALAANADAWATMPILRHHEGGIYYRDHGDRVGIGSFHHRGMPIQSGDIDTHPRRVEGLEFVFTEPEWVDAWRLTVELLPDLDGLGLERRFNGVFAFTPDGYPLVGEHPDLEGFWVAESVWVTHSAGVARGLAETLVHGGAWIDMSPSDLSRFDERELAPSFFEARCEDQYRDVYVAHHPVEPHVSARGIRWSAFAEHERGLGAEFFDVATWERPQWYAANASLLDGVAVPSRDAWSASHWSPVSLAEHLAVRERAGLFDMTPLTRIEVTGPGAEAFLLRMTTGRVDRPAGAVSYCLLLDDRGGIRSDITVARFAEDRFVVGGNGPRDIAWLRQHLQSDGSVQLTPISDVTACAALWGPAARDVLQPLSSDDLSNEAFPYLTASSIDVGGLAVDATRISYAGELGWELTVRSEAGGDLWDRIWEGGRLLGLIAAGRAALGTLRLEKGYRAWGTDMTPEHGPVEAGLAFALRSSGVDFIGRAAVQERRQAARTLRCVAIEDDQVVMGGEPVLIDGEPVGYVTSAGFGPSVGRSIAYAWVPADLQEAARVDIAYFERMLPAVIVSEPLFDPEGVRLRA
ncbi:MAG: dimethylglycine oxidase [Actinomycetota bacterium]|nr:dimethylglycine oxidase [Actinomycetota bacterium]